MSAGSEHRLQAAHHHATSGGHGCQHTYCGQRGVSAPASSTSALPSSSSGVSPPSVPFIMLRNCRECFRKMMASLRGQALERGWGHGSAVVRYGVAHGREDPSRKPTTGTDLDAVLVCCIAPVLVAGNLGKNEQAPVKEHPQPSPILTRGGSRAPAAARSPAAAAGSSSCASVFPPARALIPPP